MFLLSIAVTVTTEIVTLWVGSCNSISLPASLPAPSPRPRVLLPFLTSHPLSREAFSACPPVWVPPSSYELCRVVRELTTDAQDHFPVTPSREKVHALETDLTLKRVSVTSHVELFAISEIMDLGTS